MESVGRSSGRRELCFSAGTAVIGFTLPVQMFREPS